VAAVLRPFDYLLHIDFSFIATRNKYFYFLPRFADVEALIRTKPEVELIALRHRERALVRREWQVTTKKENGIPASNLPVWAGDEGQIW
jgi:hypothetical protein